MSYTTSVRSITVRAGIAGVAAVVSVIGGIGLPYYPTVVRAATQMSSADATDYLPDITLTNQYGKTVSLESLKGKPLLVSFIHTSCKGVCELMTAKMKDVADDLGANGTKVTMVSISTDPGDDGPAQLMAYAKKENVANGGFVFLTGKPAAIKQVLEVYGVNQQPGDNEMTHVFELFLIGPDGRQVRRYHGLNIQAAKVADDIQHTLAD
ncbi:MAG TPA: SCO family protein [Candidatus Binataceae bacterium]|nr:SCO family protein [Candidatus Binataceae bacterium]